NAITAEIAKSLNAAMVDIEPVRKDLWIVLLKGSDVRGKVLLIFSQVIGKKALLHNAINKLILRAERHIRMGITEHLMTLTLPPDNCLSLGKDFTAGFPATLQQPENTKLLTFLTKIDPTANSVAETGATDWADWMKDYISSPTCSAVSNNRPTYSVKLLQQNN
ncbi:MAG TPA: hypothetical protein VK369_13890, partial [Segetibacter sp.]|nr:hypothetical protein [Segetibacter sp.]